jgi:hypothetical protein
MFRRSVGSRVPWHRQICERKRRLAYLRSRCRSLVFVTAVSMIASACATWEASPVAASEQEAFAQFKDQLETSSGVKLAGLYVTGLEGSSSEGNQAELTWTLERLPCPGGSYRFISTDVGVNNSQTSISEAQIKVLSAQLPHGIHCGTSITSSLAQGSTSVTVSPAQRGKAGPPTSEFSSGGTQIKSFSDCLMFSELCTGKFRFVAYFRSPAGELVLQYRFEVSRVRSIATESAFGPNVDSNANGGLQCSIV